jgi:hypothetical protein
MSILIKIRNHFFEEVTEEIEKKHSEERKIILKRLGFSLLFLVVVFIVAFILSLDIPV